jgi:hypothetical protein
MQLTAPQRPSGRDQFTLDMPHREDAATLAEMYRLPRDVTERIVAMARSIDQAHAIAGLMK